MKMSEKKNIDRIFQERFKDFEVAPSDAVWQKIKEKKKEDRKPIPLIPIWGKIGSGVAAAITLLFIVGFLWNKNRSSSTNQQFTTITSSDNKESIPLYDKDSITTYKTNTPAITNNIISNTSIIDSINILKTNAAAITILNNDEKSKNEERTNVTDSSIKSYSTTNPIIQKTKSNDIIREQEKQKALLANINSSKKKKSDQLNNKKFLSPEKKDNHSSYAKNTLLAKSNPSQPLNNDSTTTSNFIDKTSIFDLTNNRKNSEKAFIAENKTSFPLDKDSTKTSNSIKKKSIFDAIKENEDAEEIVIAENTKRWGVAPNVAPIYYNSINGGSSIDSEFSDNNKNGGVNLSYGIQVTYAINNKLSIRSGISNVALSYATEDVGFGPSITAKNISNINYSTNATTINVSDYQNTPSTNSISAEVDNRAANLDQNLGFLNQEIDYIEVPLEAKYSLINNKIGLDMIGGVSTLFLKDNSISINAGDFTTPIGEANNLNNISFSGNIGLGLNYKLNTQFQINLEPIFKYQLNAFNNNSGNFKPYYFGVYTGVSFKF